MLASLAATLARAEATLPSIAPTFARAASTVARAASAGARAVSRAVRFSSASRRATLAPPLAQIAVGPRVDRRLLDRLDVAGERQLRLAVRAARDDHADRRNQVRGIARLGGDLRIPLDPRHDPQREQDDEDRHADHDPHCLHALASVVCAAPGPASASMSQRPGGVRRRTLYTTGTKKSVANVATDRPPITARPSGAFCSPPSPSPNDIGSMPITIASAVISTGRSRVAPAASAAARASRAS